MSLDVRAGECLGDRGRVRIGQEPARSSPASACWPANGRARGSARLQDEELLGAAERSLETLRGARVGLVSQDPMNALTPHLRIGEQLMEFVLDRGRMTRSEARARAIELMRSVGIPDPEARFAQYPHELSGGQRQRVAIAMALMPGPALLSPTSRPRRST